MMCLAYEKKLLIRRENKHSEILFRTLTPTFVHSIIIDIAYENIAETRKFLPNCNHKNHNEMTFREYLPVESIPSLYDRAIKIT